MAFQSRPTFSIMLNYFKRPWAIRRMASSMAASCGGSGLGCEAVVNVDNPHEAGEWAAVTLESKGFVVPVFSSNVHETRGYNRAAKVSRGKLLVVWQDDQIAPESPKWVHDLVKVFDAYPQLAIMGMNTYRLCKHLEGTNRWGAPDFWLPDPKTGVRWTYAQNVDFAPLVVRATAYEELGGLDEGFSRAGDCGIWGDWELCNRAWMLGYQTGFMFMDGRQGDGHAGGTHTGGNAEKCWGRQQLVTSSGFNKRYGAPRLQDELCDLVWGLNMRSFTLTDPNDPKKCPYGPQGLTRYGNCTKPA
ncbi:hypothetical protein HYH02_002357 [Chlamydomonas schloesseri]|uniref:Glycosyltransferase 2-like domain-containing protein n=1 Tax=Chlamydomonas schloesseri TaxID=2026947 RepID=A0A836BAW1_9CHLO|nr:hypothetical protein HYH02_002357 [Chlamydomonas schloesseri]|eukprot:KAG2453022.1 hypothetical protein HYH02_002357 [Chlamydomonas schloesseri]